MCVLIDAMNIGKVHENAFVPIAHTTAYVHPAGFQSMVFIRVAIMRKTQTGHHCFKFEFPADPEVKGSLVNCLHGFIYCIEIIVGTKIFLRRKA